MRRRNGSKWHKNPSEGDVFPFVVSGGACEHIVLVVRGMLLARCWCHNVHGLHRQLTVDFLHGVVVSRWRRGRTLETNTSASPPYAPRGSPTAWVSPSLVLHVPSLCAYPNSTGIDMGWYIPLWRGEATGQVATSSSVEEPKISVNCGKPYEGSQ